MQRLANQCLHASVPPAQSALMDLARRLTCCQTHAPLHTSTAQWRKQQPDDSEWPAASDEEAQGGASDTDVEDVTEGSTDEEADTQSAAAGSAAEQQHTQQHLGLDDPSLHILLRYNTNFMTDPDRAYSIGTRNAYDKTIRLELRKALAAQRLQLKDAAAAAAAGGRRQPGSMSQQMNSRLADMQQYLSSSVWR